MSERVDFIHFLLANFLIPSFCQCFLWSYMVFIFVWVWHCAKGSMPS